MFFQRSILAAAFASLALSLFACAKGLTGGVGGAGGGEEWSTGPTTTSSSSSGGQGGSGATFCDTNSTTCGQCEDCSKLTADGLCQVPYNDCQNEIDCTDYITCLNGCAQGDTACQTSCDTAHSLGSQLFGIYASCVICQDCYVVCGGADVCMGP